MTTIDVDGCMETLRAFVRGGEPGIRVLRKVISNVFASHGIVDQTIQSWAIRKVRLIPVEVKQQMSFLMTDGETSPARSRSFFPPRDAGEESFESTGGEGSQPPPNKRARFDYSTTATSTLARMEVV